MSEDGENTIVIIIFVGSVFSPYYAWKNWRDPGDHCAVNVALYGHHSRWTMTERRRRDTDRSATRYRIGKSEARRTSEGLVVELDEIGAPLPRRVRGQIRVSLPYQNSQPFTLDPNGRHHWAPACTHAGISVDLDSPALSWTGHGYVDMNYGTEPLQTGFDYWDWSRTPLADGATLIRYVTDPADGEQHALHLSVSPDGTMTEVSGEPSHTLPATKIWRIPRRTGQIGGQDARLVDTLEDTPFYSRSLLVHGSSTSGLTTHETLSCSRLRSPIVKAMLPFRMPRLSL